MEIRETTGSITLENGETIKFTAESLEISFGKTTLEGVVFEAIPSVTFRVEATYEIPLRVRIKLWISSLWRKIKQFLLGREPQK